MAEIVADHFLAIALPLLVGWLLGFLSYKPFEEHVKRQVRETIRSERQRNGE